MTEDIGKAVNANLAALADHTVALKTPGSMLTPAVRFTGPVTVYVNGIAHCARCRFKLAYWDTDEELEDWITEHQHDAPGTPVHNAERGDTDG